MFFESWLLGLLRFRWEFLQTIYQIVNFPFGYAFVEQEENLLKIQIEGTIFNGEVIQSIAWLMSVFLQAIFISWIYRMNGKKVKAV